MELKTSIKQHDFISGKPMDGNDRLLTDWSNLVTTNLCSEILLHGGYGRGELSTIIAPRQLGRRPAMVNMDYTLLYPEIQRQHHIIPESDNISIQSVIEMLGLTEEDISQNNNLR
jgi:hypothetical protein